MTDQEKMAQFSEARNYHTRRIMGDAMAQTIDLQAQCDVLARAQADANVQLANLTDQLGQALALLTPDQVEKITGAAPPPSPEPQKSVAEQTAASLSA